MSTLQTAESDDIFERPVAYQLLEDATDATERNQEPVYSFDDLVTRFKAEGLL